MHEFGICDPFLASVLSSQDPLLSVLAEVVNLHG